jgi:hypothetical protein
MPSLILLLPLSQRFLILLADLFPGSVSQSISIALFCMFWTGQGLIGLTGPTPFGFSGLPSQLFLFALFPGLVALLPSFPLFSPVRRLLECWDTPRPGPNQTILCGLCILPHRFCVVQFRFSEYLAGPMAFFVSRVNVFHYQMTR